MFPARRYQKQAPGTTCSNYRKQGEISDRTLLSFYLVDRFVLVDDQHVSLSLFCLFSRGKLDVISNRDVQRRSITVSREGK